MAIKLNINESKSMEFDVDIQGVTPSLISGHIRLLYENIEYGFPITVTNNTIKADIPPLNNIIRGDIKEGQSIMAKLEIIANDTYIVPWTDTITVETPIKVEALIKNTIQETKKPDISISKIKIKESDITYTQKNKKKTKLSEIFK